MFKQLLFLSLTSLLLHASELHFKTFQASFLQTIMDENSKKITYTGKIYIDGESKALWHYEAPIEKKLYFIKKSLTIIEPELEQVIMRQIQENINIYAILKRAKKVDNSTYRGSYNGKSYTLHVNSGVVEDLEYKDNFDNQVVITFENQKVDETLPKDIFSIKIPQDFDIIREQP